MARNTMWRRWVLRVWRPSLAFGMLAWILRTWGAPVIPPAAHRSDALRVVLAHRGLRVPTLEDVHWLPEIGRNHWPGMTRTVPAVVRAGRNEEAPVLYGVSTRVSPEGVLLAVDSVHRLTRSSGVEETNPLLAGQTLVTTLSIEGTTLSLQLLDLNGEPSPVGISWTTLARLQNALTNIQETGRWRGIGRRSFRFVPPVERVTITLTDDRVRVRADEHETTIPLRGSSLTTEPLPPWLQAELSEKGQVGNLITWLVDRVRATDQVGDETMQQWKALAFGLRDWVSRITSKVRRDATSSEVSADFGDLQPVAPTRVFTDPETGWPPPPLLPFLEKKIPGEGEWLVLDHDPFVQVAPALPPAFATTFLRTDRERPYTRTYVTIWDPRQVALFPVAGTIEPVDAMGTAGPGIVPRTSGVLRRLVGAFNGGFQALHGEFGMMADGNVYLPPKPYAATVATLRDGSTAFGVWPNSLEIPQDMIAYRQNLTPLVRDEQFNPYGRTWWGGTPPGWPDLVHTTRSGLCLTRENFVAYFYGNDIDAEALGRTMVQARCKLGMHLDMNPGHTGFEFYTAAPGSEWLRLGRPYQRDWEAEGDLPFFPGWRYRSRRMIRGMGLMNFPRYIQRESRDFFYLLRRALLPGNNLVPLVQPAERDEGVWRVKGLPQQGFPYALTTTTLRLTAALDVPRARLLRLDPRMLRLAGVNDASLVPVVQWQNVPRPMTAEASLWFGSSGFSIGKALVREATPLLAGALTASSLRSVGAAVGIDEDGLLLYVEIDADSPEVRAAVDRIFDQTSCRYRLWLDRSLHVLLGGATSLAGVPGHTEPGPEVRLVRAVAPGGRSIFEDTPIVGSKQWQPLQMKRIRYFHRAKDE